MAMEIETLQVRVSSIDGDVHDLEKTIKELKKAGKTLKKKDKTEDESKCDKSCSRKCIQPRDKSGKFAKK